MATKLVARDIVMTSEGSILARRIGMMEFLVQATTTGTYDSYNQQIVGQEFSVRFDSWPIRVRAIETLNDTTILVVEVKPPTEDDEQEGDDI